MLHILGRLLVVIVPVVISYFIGHKLFPKEDVFFRLLFGTGVFAVGVSALAAIVWAIYWIITGIDLFY